MTTLIHILAVIGAMTLLFGAWVVYAIVRDSREQMESHRRNQGHKWGMP